MDKHGRHTSCPHHHHHHRASKFEEMEKIAPPFLRRSGERRTAGLAIFFLDLGLGEVLHWERLEPALGGYRRMRYRLDSPAEEASTLLLAFFNSFARALARMEIRACYTHWSAPPPPQHTTRHKRHTHHTHQHHPHPPHKPTHTTPHTTLTHQKQLTMILQMSFPIRRENL